MTLPIAGTPEGNAVLEKNIADVLENGPGLRYGRGIVLVAKCQTGKHELHGGLGAMGCGQMWYPASAEHQALPEWETLPVELCWPIGDEAPCPRPATTPNEIAAALWNSANGFARSGSPVPRYILLVEDGNGGWDGFYDNARMSEAEAREALRKKLG